MKESANYSGLHVWYSFPDFVGVVVVVVVSEPLLGLVLTRLCGLLCASHPRVRRRYLITPHSQIHLHFSV